MVLDDQVWSTGEVPGEADIRALADWIGGMDGQVYETDELALQFPPAASFVAVAAGVLAISISQVHRHLILWFRPEIVRTVQWAGDPRKQPDTVDGRIHPRKSFASWKEQLHGRSIDR